MENVQNIISFDVFTLKNYVETIFTRYRNYKETASNTLN